MQVTVPVLSLSVQNPGAAIESKKVNTKRTWKKIVCLMKSSAKRAVISSTKELNMTAFNVLRKSYQITKTFPKKKKKNIFLENHLNKFAVTITSWSSWVQMTKWKCLTFKQSNAVIVRNTSNIRRRMWSNLAISHAPLAVKKFTAALALNNTSRSKNASSLF